MRFAVVPSAPRRLPVAIEWMLALAVLVGVGWAAAFLWRTGYLPQPFLYDVSDPLMDLYSTAYWSHQRGAYSVWNSIYPPLSFVVLRLTSEAACYQADPFWGRDCDALLRYLLYGCFALNVILILLVFRRTDRDSAVPRAIALGLGLPMLFALDRGNLIILTFTAFLLGFSCLLKRERWRVLALAVAINLKPYLLVAAFPRIAARHWRWLVTLGVSGVLVYVASYLFLGAGSPAELVRNSQIWNAVTGENFWEKCYLSTSFAPLVRFATSDFPLLQFVDSRLIDRLVSAFSWLMRIGLLGTAGVYLLSALAPRLIAPRRLAALTVCFLLTQSESPGGYAQVCLLVLVFAERWNGLVGAVLLVCAYLLCLPLDYSLFPVFRGPMYSWWTDRQVHVEFGVAVGQLVRPLLLLVMLYSLTWLTALEWLRRRERLRCVREMATGDGVRDGPQASESTSSP